MAVYVSSYDSFPDGSKIIITTISSACCNRKVEFFEDKDGEVYYKDSMILVDIGVKQSLENAVKVYKLIRRM